MKLDNDMFLANMNRVNLKGEKVMVWPSRAESTKGKEFVIGEEKQPRMIKPKNPETGRWKKNKRRKPQSRPKATFNIFIAKYREGRAGIRGNKKQITRLPKPDHPVSLSQTSTSAPGSTSNNRSQTLPW
jgi:hypothetical protein